MSVLCNDKQLGPAELDRPAGPMGLLTLSVHLGSGVVRFRGKRQAWSHMEPEVNPVFASS